MPTYLDIVSHEAPNLVHPYILRRRWWEPRRNRYPEFAVHDILESRVRSYPRLEQVRSIDVSAAAPGGHIDACHPAREIRFLNLRWLNIDRFLVGTVDAEIEFHEINETSWAQGVRHVIYQRGVVFDLRIPR